MAFKDGDRVRHVSRNEVGTVKVLGNGNVQVTFDNPTPRGNKSVGEYDADWFRIYPNGLVLQSEAERPSCHGSEG